MLSLVPVKKLSTHSTSLPASSRRSHRCDPMKPAPPVTSTRGRVAYWRGEEFVMSLVVVLHHSFYLPLEASSHARSRGNRGHFFLKSPAFTTVSLLGSICFR